MNEPETCSQLRPAMGFKDLLLFFMTTGISIRWITVAAAGGPSSITVWVIACLAFYIPLVVCVLELWSRYPQEGGLYQWSHRAFGDFAGFMTGWFYWTCLLPFFPAMLYYIAGNALLIGGQRWQHLSSSPTYFILASLACLVLATALNLIGLNIAKWLSNLGAIVEWLAALTLIVIGFIAWQTFGSATEFTLASFVPGLSLKNAVFWATVVFALAGIEAAPILGDEIKNARSILPGALLLSGVIVTGTYIIGTLSVLLSLPSSEVSDLQGITQAFETVGSRIGLTGLAPFAAAFIAIGFLGKLGAWITAGARLSFAVGVDKFLPAAFARVHPKWGTPYVAVLVLSLLTALLTFLGQAGTSVKGAYDVLTSMALIPTYIPFLYLFAAMIKLQGEPAGPEVIRPPGGKPVAILLAVLGFATTVAAIILSVIPAEDEINKPLAVVKVIGLALVLTLIGVAIYWIGSRRQAQERTRSMAV
jgi:glutamate:GABA antiporter